MPPPAAVTVMVAPGSPVPVTTVPSAPMTALGAVGAVTSGAVTVVAGDTLPAESVSVTVTLCPLACAGRIATMKPPSAPTVPVPMDVPVESRTVTVAPASPVPETALPSAATVAAGAVGAVKSGAAIVVGADRLPAASAWVTAIVPPLPCAGVNTTAKAPVALAVVVPSTVPSAARTVMVAPASPLPMTIAPVPSRVATGAPGAVRSGAIAVAGGETSPSASVWVTRIVSPSMRGGVSAMT